MSNDPDVARHQLQADCSRCFALCCVAPAFAASVDFAIDKPAGNPCLNLTAGFRCGIHTELRLRGFRGCTVYDCFGAGQHVSQVTFAGSDWRQAPHTASSMFAVFAVVRQLHELLWYLDQAAQLVKPGGELALRIAADRRLTEQIRDGSAPSLLSLDVDTHRRTVNDVLTRTSDAVRADRPGPRAEHRGDDLIGVDLRRHDLRAANLRGARLIGADLREVDLHGADVIGADLRAARIAGADLSGALFLIQSQLDAAAGDRRTRLPPGLVRPAHW